MARRPTPAWKAYQKEAASFFRKLGLDAETDVQTTGARGTNKLDVTVNGSVGGLPFRWIVECKHWKRNVPKEKAQAFLTVVQNVGADRGYLLSEKGFQSGAMDVVRHTNVHLGSISALKADTEEWIKGDLVRRWREQKSNLVRRLLDLHRKNGGYFSDYSAAAGEIFGLDSIIDKGLRGEFPVPFNQVERAIDWDDLAAKIENKLESARQAAEIVDEGLP